MDLERGRMSLLNNEEENIINEIVEKYEQHYNL